ncbi:hypothetical protein [Methanococcus voltae]|uniref:hypothetical protein n=1 Tax=Methanococcus voltae TaxID=2188 RepID=UPI001AE2E9FE|nr:hypothetical protein [Methanococcus voltae]MBP2173097.1 hypothetical protein [Methanococcus voltae]
MQYNEELSPEELQRLFQLQYQNREENDEDEEYYEEEPNEDENRHEYYDDFFEGNEQPIQQTPISQNVKNDVLDIISRSTSEEDLLLSVGATLGNISEWEKEIIIAETKLKRYIHKNVGLPSCAISSKSVLYESERENYLRIHLSDSIGAKLQNNVFRNYNIAKYEVDDEEPTPNRSFINRIFKK